MEEDEKLEDNCKERLLHLGEHSQCRAQGLDTFPKGAETPNFSLVRSLFRTSHNAERKVLLLQEARSTLEDLHIFGK